MAALPNGSRCLRFYDCPSFVKKHSSTSWPNMYSFQRLSNKDSTMKCSISSTAKFDWSSSLPHCGGRSNLFNKRVVNVVSPEITAPSFAAEFLDASEDEYNGVIIDPESLPSSANAFVSALRTSLSHWKSKGKKGVWLKIPPEQAVLVPIAIQEGFSYHHAELGYVMLTHWIPGEPSMLPGRPSHQIGVGGFVINDKREVLVVTEKCPCSCSGVWKFPTGYINKCEDLFSAAIREVKEETGVDTVFQEMVAFR